VQGLKSKSFIVFLCAVEACTVLSSCCLSDGSAGYRCKWGCSADSLLLIEHAEDTCRGHFISAAANLLGRCIKQLEERERCLGATGSTDACHFWYLDFSARAILTVLWIAKLTGLLALTTAGLTALVGSSTR